MSPHTTPSRFTAPLRRPAARSFSQCPWAFVLLPRSASDALPRRGRTTVEGTINGHPFCVLAEPDGELGHWLNMDRPLLDAAGVQPGDTAAFTLWPVAHEPEPEVPPDLAAALASDGAARQGWQETTALARLDWIHWMTSATQAGTRAKRMRDACGMLAAGKRRVCCFDPSGHYSKAFRAPVEAAQTGL